MNHQPTIHLTEDLQLVSGRHIVYIYNDHDAYLDNAIAFIQSGLEQHHHIIFIERPAVIEQVRGKLSHRMDDTYFGHVHFVDAESLYGPSDAFNQMEILSHFNQVTQVLRDQRVPLRSWGRVLWRDQDDIEEALKRFEDEVDDIVNPLGLVTVCAYHGKQISAELMSNLMRTHEYFMTDTEIAKSPIYTNNGKAVVPSLSIQRKIQSEVDLYKQKLDFIHVISHEVRNPLTIIKAYATLLLEDTAALPKDAQNRIQAIADYADVIDHEMTDIIHTEQMLSSDELWQMEVIDPQSQIQSVIDFMRIKARLQGICLESELHMNGEERMRCNPVGFKLVASNILSNAIKYSTEGSKVWIRVCSQKTELVIEIEDQGIGMTDDQLANLFQKYGKMNQDHDGQGIGLYMVKTLVDHFGGAIQIRSEVNKGTRVTVHLPLHQASNE